MKGLICSVFRDASHGDCSNNGITNRYTRVILVGPGIPEIFEPSDDMPALRFIPREGWGGYYATTLVDQEDSVGPNAMFGGNFIYSSDSRFPSKQPIPVHDRFETWEMYNRLSR